MTWAAFWDATTAVGTVAMAATTYIAILQNKQQRQEIARQHQDMFKPVCVLDAQYPAGPMAVLKTENLASDAKTCPAVLLCSVNNIGAGCATNVRLGIHLPLDSEPMQPPFEIGALGANQSMPLSTAFSVHLSNYFTSKNNPIPTGLFVLWLEYQDIFGNRFYSRNSRNPGEPWVTLGDGDIPRNAR